MCQMKMTDCIKPQLRSFLEGFYEVIPRDLISIFNEQELELMISGMPVIDLEDLRNNTEYHKYSPSDLQVRPRLPDSLPRFVSMVCMCVDLQVHHAVEGFERKSFPVACRQTLISKTSHTAVSSQLIDVMLQFGSQLSKSGVL